MKLRLKSNRFISTNCPALDDMLDGGLQYNTMSHFYGTAGTGKTTFAMQIAAIVIQKGDGIIWVDTNDSFDPKRFIEINHDNSGAISKIKLFRPQSYEKNAELYHNLEKYIDRHTKLIVIDPITYFYRLHSRGNVEFRLRRDLFNTQIPTLARIVLTHDLHIILVNQSRGSIGEGIKAVGGVRLNKYCKYVFKFEQKPPDTKLRYICLEKLFQKNPNLEFSFKLNQYGFHGCKKC